MTFTEFAQLYSAYKMFNQPVQPIQQPVQQPIQQPVQPIQQPTNADIMAALAAMQVPQVQGQPPQVATVDDIICKIAGISVPAENKKEDK